MELEIRRVRAEDEAAVIDLWQRCDLVVPWNDPLRDIERKLAFQPELFLVAALAGRVVGSVMAGYEGHRGQINYLAVDPLQRDRQLGRQLMQAAEAALRALGCQKINLQVRASNGGVVAFYESLGFQVETTINMGKRLET